VRTDRIVEALQAEPRARRRHRLGAQAQDFVMPIPQPHAWPGEAQ